MRVLGIGIAALDVVNQVADYPAEDTEVRALDQWLNLGGNAANTLVVLSQLGHPCAWCGALAEDSESERILFELRGWGIDTEGCRRHSSGRAPTSYVCLSRATGSRTIVHHRDLPEYSADDFRGVDLRSWDWVHFEGREPSQTVEMLHRVRRERPELRCSLEIEKPRPGIETLFHLPDVLLFSRQFARYRGYSDARAFLQAMRKEIPRRLLFCAWGEQGAAALDPGGMLCTCPAFPPPRIQDTLGAGDVFNAGVIHGLLQALTLSETLELACRLAGKKCGQHGFGFLAAPSSNG